MSDPRRRWLLPPVAVAILALVGSLSLHIPAYFGLGLLESLLEEEDKQAPAPIEMEIVDSRPTEASDPETEVAPAPPEDEPPPPEEETAPPPERERERHAERQQHEEERQQEEETPPIPVPSPATPPPPPPPPSPQPERQRSVAQHSQDPSVPPPDDAQYLAEENNRVEEETLARIANPNTDDPEPQPAAAEEPPPESPDEGDSAEEEVADLHEQEGSDERDPTPEEAQLPPERHPPETQASRSPRPDQSQAAEGGGREGGNDGQSQPATAAGGGRRARGGGEVAMREVVIHDALGTYRIRVPADRPLGEGEGEGGGVAVAGRGRGNEGSGRASGRAGRGRSRGRGGGRSGRGAPNLRLSWNQFSSIYGQEELDREREAWLEQRRSRSRGASHQERWDRFRAALENYDVQVRPGNQTALNTRADPFAAFIASMHRRIHQRFAEGFLTHIPSTVEATFQANPDMYTLLEIAVDAEGHIARIGIVSTSGDILFDFGAYNAVMASQPFESPSEAIRSPDGLAYMHWAFFRNQRQCGTFNANPYILAHAPSPGHESGHGVTRPDTLFRPSPMERGSDTGE